MPRPIVATALVASVLAVPTLAAASVIGVGPASPPPPTAGTVTSIPVSSTDAPGDPIAVTSPTAIGSGAVLGSPTTIATSPTTAVVERPTSSVPASTVVVERPIRTTVPTTRPDDRPVIRFACEPNRADEGVVVACKWTEARGDRVAGYRLLRAVDDDGRAVIFQTRDLSQHGHRDPVRPGHTYHYAVQFLGRDGGVLATSDAVHLRIPAPEPTVAVKAACDVVRVDDGSRAGVVCEWAAERNDALRGFLLQRRDSDGRFHTIARGGVDFRRHLDDQVRPGRHAYRVIAVDESANPIGRSHEVAVSVPAPPTDTRPTDTRPTDSKPTDTRPTDTQPAATEPTDVRSDRTHGDS